MWEDDRPSYYGMLIGNHIKSYALCRTVTFPMTFSDL